jgi:glycosyltransferase involved in cell wall biosynthesis
MNIVLVHDWLTGMRGGEKCLEPVCRRFAGRPLLTLLHTPGQVSPAIERMAIETSFLQRLPGVSRYYRALLPLMPLAAERLRIPSDTDLVLSFSHAVAKGVIVPRGVPHVCYCFTPMRYAWDRRDDYLRGPLFGLGPVRWAAEQALERLRRWDRQASDRVTHFVAISNCIAERIRQCYGRPSQVIYPPVDTQFYTPGPVAREDYYVCVSALVPYKRVDLAIEACNRLGRRLVVIGSGPERRRLTRLAGPGVTLAGWLSDEAVREHLRRARALLFAAHEDFGIVPLEAQACGTPVIAFGQGGAAETVIAGSAERPGTGLLFAEQTVDALTHAICQFENHPQWFDPELARRNAERFGGQRFEQELMACLEHVVAQARTSDRVAA